MITEEKLNPPFEIDVSILEDELKSRLNKGVEKYSKIVSLKEIKKIHQILLFKRKTLERLLKKTPLRGFDGDGKDKKYPYQEAKIEVSKIDPSIVKLGQRFLSKSKLHKMISQEEDSCLNVLKEYITQGISKIPPILVYGEDIHKNPRIAIYIPPLIEVHGKDTILIDGTHRAYLCSKVGTTTLAVYIQGNLPPLPFEPINWEEIQITERKPPIKERYKNLNQRLFRDLRKIGIDS